MSIKSLLSKIWSEWWWLIVLCAIKLIVQLAVADNYGFHRDEYLYLAQGRHLAWGYMENPPLLGLVSWFILLFGKGILWIKFFPALVGAISMILIAIMTRDLGGKRWAQFLACFAFLLVPAYLRTHHMLQPVFLNQFMWLLLTFSVIKLVKSDGDRWWYVIGVIIGVGLLTKYSLVFPVIGLAVGLVLTPERKWLGKKEPYLAALIALLIFLPNLLWQYNHNWPVLNHMDELRRTQLVNVEPVSFIVFQFMMPWMASLLWVPGLFGLLAGKLKRFQIIAFMYLVVIIILLVSSGKPYYSLGIYPALIAAGAVWWEQTISGRTAWKYALPAIIGFFSIGIIPYGIPILPVDKMMSYGLWMKDNFGLEGPLMWEDGESRALPQDYADMYGWEEAVANAADVYHKLTPEQQAQCNFWGGSYGHAGSIMHFAEKYGLPGDLEVLSFNGSFALWAPDEIDFEHQISIDDRFNDESTVFRTVEFIDSTSNPYARDPGYIFWKTGFKVDRDSTWSAIIEEYKYRWSRK